MTVPVVLVHGGAGNIDDGKRGEMIEGVKSAALRGYEVLKKGGTCLDAAQACVECMEANPVFNAGRGSVLNCDGEVEMDAIIMEGTHLNFGSVGAIKNILHPIALARRIMEKSRASMLVGDGASRFAREEGFEATPSFDLATDENISKWKSFAANTKLMDLEFECAGLGTVGAVVLDSFGKVACATSTGGTMGKPGGRVGDTPLPGSGGYANDAIGAVSATGRGESIMKVCLSHRILNLMEQGKSAQQATEEALDYLKSTVGDGAGAITVSRTGDIGISFITKAMSWAFVKGNGPVVAGIHKPNIA